MSQRAATSLSTKVLLLGSLYLTQGLPFGFFVQTLPVVLREEGVSLEAIGLTSLLAIPWALKFLVGPLVDRSFLRRLGRRRSWILPLQASAVLMMAILATIDPGENLTALLVAVLLINLVSATQDVATDGLAVDLLKPAERGLGNGIQVAGYRVGMVVGGGLILIVIGEVGWSIACGSIAMLLALASIPIVLHQEEEGMVDDDRASFWSVLTEFVRRPGAKSWLAAIMAYKVGGALSGGMVRPFLVDLDLGIAEIGWVMGIAGFVFGLIGALLGGLLVNRIGRRAALVGFGLGDVVACMAYVIPAMVPVSLGWLTVVVAVEHLVGGMATVALFTAMMDGADSENAATAYTIQASAVVMATGIGASLGGFLAGGLGYATHFGASALVVALGVWVIARVELPGAQEARSQNA